MNLNFKSLYQKKSFLHKQLNKNLFNLKKQKFCPCLKVAQSNLKKQDTLNKNVKLTKSSFKNRDTFVVQLKKPFERNNLYQISKFFSTDKNNQKDNNNYKNLEKNSNQNNPNNINNKQQSNNPSNLPITSQNFQKSDSQKTPEERTAEIFAKIHGYSPRHLKVTPTGKIQLVTPKKNVFLYQLSSFFPWNIINISLWRTLIQNYNTPITFFLIQTSLIVSGLVGFEYFFPQILNTGINSESLAFIPMRIWNGEYYRILTSIFLHQYSFHVIFNCTILMTLGRTLEIYHGYLKFLLFIFFAIIFSLSFYSFFEQPFSPFEPGGCGISGVIFYFLGIGAISTRQKWKRQSNLSKEVLRENKFLNRFLFKLNGVYLFILISSILLYLSEFFFVNETNFKIAHFAHLGGFFGGLLYGYLPFWIYSFVSCFLLYTLLFPIDFFSWMPKVYHLNENLEKKEFEKSLDFFQKYEENLSENTWFKLAYAHTLFSKEPIEKENLKKAIEIISKIEPNSFSTRDEKIFLERSWEKNSERKEYEKKLSELNTVSKISEPQKFFKNRFEYGQIRSEYILLLQKFKNDLYEIEKKLPWFSFSEIVVSDILRSYRILKSNIERKKKEKQKKQMKI